MIYIGLTGWGDHYSLYEGVKSHQKLETYAGYFPIVELDSSFYAVQSRASMEKWIRETPNSFKFIVKAYQDITGHQRGESPFSSRDQMYEAFKDSLEPLIQANKLAMVLCQFPPWFDVTTKHVHALRFVREKLRDFPTALEFRHQSWFDAPYKEKTLQYMREDDWIHSICDEPQAGPGSIPTILEPTTKEKTLVRFHGRNRHGWNGPRNGENWRDVRYLYDYNQQELKEWEENLQRLSQKVDDVFVVFNNNSGGHAAGNARSLIQNMNIAYKDLASRQLDLF
ncbi:MULTISPECIES: DUF72 domain-containing protein [Shouchella]|uniref:DUF72 domain-containing protein n=3 Tax=Bacillaceae TaxID=186817 RepID=A0A060LZ95_9BACI|nr:MULTISPECIES: DUF72 domain-containing protein [Bacillaceae]RQW21251.1 DUF72 domain-containing protein [Bacillus sp. C1-1]AIC95522.1 hypothetical protein BleG1_2958 [Shouchella lehensis G1]KQL55657.1 hypothetical protein AN965_17500 [Alkalicoccobacillus plakortidis]MBG9783764.1 hypothetical protein [Shouchella lehensis]TES51280.1 DUF72 domain-containing protein [Shouchella lehensis]